MSNTANPISKTYIPCPKALKLLVERFAATPQEIAAWVWMGPEFGGLTAYTHAGEGHPPPRFHFDEGFGADYLRPLMACWFDSDELATFKPGERFMSSQALIERWQAVPGIEITAFIQAKIAESRLMDFHPCTGSTQWSDGEEYPSKDSALFALSHIRAVEHEDLGIDAAAPTPTGTPKVGGKLWRKVNARNAANARHGQPGGSRAKRKQVQDAWATGQFRSRNECAQTMAKKLGISPKTARNALIGTPDPVNPPRC